MSFMLTQKLFPALPCQPSCPATCSQVPCGIPLSILAPATGPCSLPPELFPPRLGAFSHGITVFWKFLHTCTTNQAELGVKCPSPALHQSIMLSTVIWFYVVTDFSGLFSSWNVCCFGRMGHVFFPCLFLFLGQ